jgi:DNA repair exonuclease SbcCD ATPase subunit
MPVTPRLGFAVALLTLLAGCAALEGGSTRADAAAAAPPAPPPEVLAPYLDTLGKMAPGDPARQQAELSATLAAAEQNRTAANTLRYALALGSAGHANSNPVEARRLISELLAGANTLDPAEAAFASAYRREFDARVALYAELGRQREESEQKLASLDATADRRADALAAENRQLKRALAEAERKLEAVAEMERALLEQTSEAPAEPPQRP